MVFKKTHGQVIASQWMSVALWRMRGCWVESTHIKVYQSGTAVLASTF